MKEKRYVDQKEFEPYALLCIEQEYLVVRVLVLVRVIVSAGPLTSAPQSAFTCRFHKVVGPVCLRRGRR